MGQYLQKPMKPYVRYLKEVVNLYDENYPKLSWDKAYLTILKKNRPELYEKYFSEEPDSLSEKELLDLLEFVRKSML